MWLLNQVINMVLWELGCEEGRQKEMGEDDVEWQALLSVYIHMDKVLFNLQVLL